MIEDEAFFAWLDGELPPEEAAEVERRVAADPQLSRLAGEHRAMAAGLRQAFDQVAGAPVPQALGQAVRSTPAEVVSLASWRTRLSQPFAGPIPHWAAMAATLALGIVVGTTLDSGGTGSPVEMRGGQIYAAGVIDEALDRQLASTGNPGDVRIGLTFRDRGGAVCRSFESMASTGLACREQGDWRLRGLFAAPEDGDTEFRMAAGADPRLMELVESTMAGEPFDAAEERAARRRGWK